LLFEQLGPPRFSEITYLYLSKDTQILAITKNNDFWLPDANGYLLKFQI